MIEEPGKYPPAPLSGNERAQGSGSGPAWGASLTSSLLAAETGGGGLHATGHDPGDGSQLQSLQAEQAPDPAGSPHDGEAGEAAEDRAGEEAPAEAPGTPWALRFLLLTGRSCLGRSCLGRAEREGWEARGGRRGHPGTERFLGAHMVCPHHFVV